MVAIWNAGRLSHNHRHQNLKRPQVGGHGQVPLPALLIVESVLDPFLGAHSVNQVDQVQVGQLSVQPFDFHIQVAHGFSIQLKIYGRLAMGEQSQKSSQQMGTELT
jgi:hypothetical protein